MQARQSKPSQIFHAARAAGVLTNDTLDQSILKLGESLASISASIPKQSIPLLSTLSNNGVQYGDLQNRTKKDLQEATNINVTNLLIALEETLSTSNGPYFFGTELTPTDCTLICATTPILSLLYTIRPYPNIARWFALITGSKWCSDILGIQRALGTTRIGGQIDLRPNPIDTYAAAMNSIHINKGQKKKTTQRQKEKNAKKNKQDNKTKSKKNNNNQETKTSSNPMDASEDSSLPFLLGPRVEVIDGKEKRMKTIHDTLTKVNISFTTENHVATPTVEDLMRETGHLKGGHCKNLFVKGKKKSRTRNNDTKLWLVVALHDTVVDMKKLSKMLGYKDAMRMGKSELLNEKLAVIQGEVSPLALTNNKECDVQVVLDSKMMKEDCLWFHPLTMEASTSLTPNSLLEFVKLSGRDVEIVDFDNL